MPYLGFLAAILFVIFQGSIRLYTANIVGQWLVSNIRDSTEGNYLLEYDYVRFDIFTKELRIKNLDLALDSARISEDEYLQHNNNLIYLSTPTVVLKLSSLWDLIFNDKLSIAYIGMQEPNVRFTRSESISAAEKVAKQLDASAKLRSYLNELEIDSFKIVKASIEVTLEDKQRHQVLNFRIGDLTTFLKNFKLDNVDTTKALHGIYAEEFELEILDQVVTLPDIHHRVAFERLWISSNDSIIQLDTLNLIPLPSASQQNLKGNVYFNQFVVSGIDLKDAYLNNELDIKQIALRQPDIRVTGKLPKKEENTESLQWFYVLFNKIRLREIDIYDGNFDIDLGNKIAFSNLGLGISEFKLDSAYIDIDAIKYALTDFHFDVGSTTLGLPDNVHQVEVGSVHLSSNDSIAILNSISLNPILSKRSYQEYKKNGVRLVSYSNVKNIILSGVDYYSMIVNNQFLADTIIVANPEINITEYPYITTRKKGNGVINPFLLNTVLFTNGSLKYNKRQSGTSTLTELSGINANITNLFNDSENSVAYDRLSLMINSGSSQLQNLQHTLRFKGFKSNNIEDFDVTRLSLTPDNKDIKGPKFNLSAAFIRVRGFDQQALQKSKSLKLDKFTIQQLSFTGDTRYAGKALTSGSSGKQMLKNVLINQFYIKNADLGFKTKDVGLAFNNVSTAIDTLNYIITPTRNESPVSFYDLKLKHGNFSITANKSAFHMSGKFGQFIESDSLINFQNLNVRLSNNIKGRLKSLILTGFDRKQLMRDNGVKFNYLIADMPDFEINPDQEAVHEESMPKTFHPDSLKASVLRNIAFIDFDSIVFRNANLKIASAKRVTEIIKARAIIGKYRLDSLSDSNLILSPGQLRLHINDVVTHGENDTITVQGVTLDMVRNRLFTGEINVSSHMKANHLLVGAPGLSVSGFSAIGILNGDFSMDSIRIAEAKVTLVAPQNNDQLKSTEEKRSAIIDQTLVNMFKQSSNILFDSLLQFDNTEITRDVGLGDSLSGPVFKRLMNKLRRDADDTDELAEDEQTNQQDTTIATVIADLQDMDNVEEEKTVPPSEGLIKSILISNSTFTLKRDENPHSYFSGLNFSININRLLLDSLSKFNIYDHVDNLTVKVNNYHLNLPDSLNSLSFDQLSLSTKNELIELNGLSLTPRVGKYEYAPLKGRQASWQHLQDLDIKLEKVNLFKLISDNVLYAHKITTYNGTLDLFKDKELPIPVNQRRPMPQDAIKSLNLPILVDSVAVNNFYIKVTNRISSAYPEGSITLEELNAEIGNITNIDSVIQVKPYTMIKANTRIMGQGMLSANFTFDLNDENNRFIYDAHLSAMDANAFNDILEATAFVKVESGKIKDLVLEAEGDNYYSTGNMRFIYSNLKVSTINKKNLKTKGMGKVIKTFFANAFVVKKNNPSFKFFPREGAMYYERNPQKLVFDYVTKTALSGIVSSIGARNARKDIKRIQRESKKQKDEERKALKKANKKSQKADN